MGTTSQNKPDQTKSDVINNINKRTSTPRLKCIITGEERITNSTYLTKKAQAAGGDISRYLSHYISRKALKFLRMGKTVQEARHALNVDYSESINPQRLEEALKLNGKWSKNVE